jgi:hypothetical protein
MEKLTKEKFIEKSKLVHGDKYNYENISDYDSKTKIPIICSIHGEFYQLPHSHLSGRGCPKCAGKEKKDIDSVLKSFNEAHGDKYDYSMVDYVNTKTKVKIICDNHGMFEQTPAMHLKGQGCPICKIGKIRETKIINNRFIEKASKKHNFFYNYDKVNYINNKSSVIINCPIHGDFNQIPFIHLDGSGCPKCVGRVSTNTEEFKKIALLIHGDRYDYSKSIYKGSKTKLTITCSIHGDFEQIPNTHLKGCGCPKCNLFGTVSENKLFENLKKEFKTLEVLNKFSPKWLGKQHFDIFIPKLKIAIEYQGGQHFKPIKFFGGEKEFEKIVKRDENKRKKCEMKKIKLLYFSYDNSYVPNDYPHKVYNNENELFNIIKLDL